MPSAVAVAFVAALVVILSMAAAMTAATAADAQVLHSLLLSVDGRPLRLASCLQSPIRKFSWSLSVKVPPNLLEGLFQFCSLGFFFFNGDCHLLALMFKLNLP